LRLVLLPLSRLQEAASLSRQDIIRSDIYLKMKAPRVF